MYQLVNGSHHSKSQGYFEWWYFHFASASGFNSNIVLHETDIFGLTKSPYVSMSFQFPHRDPQYHHISIPPGSIERGSEYLSQVDGYFQESERQIRIRLVFPSKVNFELIVTKLVEPLMLNNCVLYQEGDRSSYWKVQVPFGRFSGVLTVEGKNYPVEGVVYHDHQWGNIPIQDFVSDWVWGNFSSYEGSATFYAIQTQRGELIERYAVVTSRSVQASIAHGQVPHLSMFAQSVSPDLLQDEPIVSFPFSTTLRTSINPSGILRARIAEAHSGFVTTYIRWAGDAFLSSFTGSLYGITEYIRIRKEN